MNSHVVAPSPMAYVDREWRLVEGSIKLMELWGTLDKIGIVIGIVSGVCLGSTWFYYQRARRQRRIAHAKLEELQKFIDGLQQSVAPPPTDVSRRILDFNPERKNEPDSWESYVFKLKSSVSEPFEDTFVYWPSQFIANVKHAIEGGEFIFYFTRFFAALLWLIVLVPLIYKAPLPWVLVAILPALAVSVGSYTAYKLLKKKKQDLEVGLAYLKALKDRNIRVEHVFTQINEVKGKD